MTNSPQHRILIADDEPLYLRTTGELLRKSGYDCVCVPNAQQALEALQTQPFDLILSDLNMPGNFKLELLRAGRSNWSHIPLIVVTGVPSIPSAIESIRLGITDYLLKPVKFEDLLSSVRRAISSTAKTPPPATTEDREPFNLSDRYPEIIG
ncbi:MAG TPA: sigma-54-dependent Fis family transcriptional regulator, partial [Planctomycetaceae bacterium]|nr:sigma-54-dependent Fis family transcriptional regulator [Planctomycetaceae bacterium]